MMPLAGLIAQANYLKLCQSLTLISYLVNLLDRTWGGCSEAEVLALMDAMNSQNKLNSDGKVVIGVLPEDIPI